MPDNIILLLTDQQRFDSLGAHGCGAIATPNLDALVADGVDFTSCQVNCPLCTPSRASLFSGLELPAHGVYQLHDVLPGDIRLFPERLKDFGYQTALIGKLHVSGRLFERDHRNPHDGFDVYEPSIDPAIGLDDTYNDYGRFLRERFPDVYQAVKKDGKHFRNFPAGAHFTTWVVDRSLYFLDHADKRKPFFLCAGFFDPHDPYYDYPPEMAALVDAAKIPPIAERPDGMPSGAVREGEKFFSGGAPMTPEEILDMRMGYLASVKFLDIQIGRLVEHLKRNNLYDSAMIIFASDHGDMLGDRRLLGKGGFGYDASVRVPLAVKLPGSRLSGLVCGDLVQPHDIAATAMAAAGAAPERITGWMPQALPLESVARGKTKRDYCVTEFKNSGYSAAGRYYENPIHMSVVFSDRYKLVVYHDTDGTAARFEGELFDRMLDPGERRSLWDDAGHAAVKAELLMVLLNRFARYDVATVSGRGGQALPWESGEKTYAMVNKAPS